ncbi:hypothetical protein A3G55_02460 [Candidatus Giovannonibacteria bacterium RIFCSPLOWO2_12_FULL_44_25]|uniref:Uncharacterized protein n=1 Tax=Candidatus Giovannonibacteria bacterium RIFCSPHIGHO2_02_FULL_45_40 TaxID=1798337 RepID=A0A1F5WAS6_9BACT|nr:MAG: hypothetical protein A2120_00825 [Candidatus Giovannonibacteria bacterium GWA2_45_15]OGF60715.1 MAG: hypothetical protein A2656_01275 [Candidatus Giovannonibacteria bacterium RIFCSPHIGHO2_01_FULL_44_100]OGF72766.1 MAG: hypothetical protein A3C05_00515 [Candidatus Giovannonibacteria bacterium RIFCSPHIGHO2_02_FULL_45_40]OGF84029.1 MAG: hypothetical protein A3E63_03765 [Candidatus Giovannonibacteria bacterium RIFCSPHIGHO2_12_FULL_45_19]OGF84878.1 MAG: hypothetical protein A3A19_04245 [Cand
MRKRLAIYAALFGTVVLFDWLKFVYVGGPNIINWNSLAHPVWVATTLVILSIAVFQPRREIISVAFLLYFAVFATTLLNQYLHFYETLTYNCMLFNLVFATMFYLVSNKR